MSADSETKKSTMADTWCRTTVNVDKVSFLWKIENFSYCLKKCGEFIESEEFSSTKDPDRKWRLRLYPYGRTSENIVSLYILFNTTSNQKTVDAKYGISVLNHKSENTNEMWGVLSTLKEEIVYGVDDFLKRDVLFGEGESGEALLPNDTLTLYCEICVVISTAKESGKTFDAGPEPKSCLAADLTIFFESRQLSDVTFVIGKEEAKAHKAILAARSSVFKSMFMHDMQESNENRVEIKDMEPKVFHEMLRFMYSGQLRNDHDLKVNLDLLVAADKYDLHDLKDSCENVLMTTLTVDDVVEVLLMAILHKAERLKKKADDFIRCNIENVKITEGWKKLKRNRDLPPFKHKCKQCSKWYIK